MSQPSPQPSSTTSAEFFEQKYAASPDPWNFAGSDYETSRYTALIAALGDRPCERVFEPGCSVGELTWRLAERCNCVEALDLSPTAVARARQRCAAYPHVEITVGGLPGDIPPGDFDLIVFSELGYYFSRDDLATLAATLVSRIRPAGTLLAAHWLGTSPDHLLSGDTVHEVLRSSNNLQLDYAERHAGFRLDRWTRQ